MVLKKSSYSLISSFRARKTERERERHTHTHTQTDRLAEKKERKRKEKKGKEAMDPLDPLRSLMHSSSPSLHALIVPSEDYHQVETFHYSLIKRNREVKAKGNSQSSILYRDPD